MPDGGSCKPSCGARVCGDDGCGGSCGKCTEPAKPLCDAVAGRCVSQCVPACSGRTCGDDGCGGTCGACATGTACSLGGRCIPEAWTCDPAWYGVGGVCDCGCGAPDPDCTDPSAPLAGCAAFETCNAAGACVSTVPKAWTCGAGTYGAHDGCNCGCGAPDPDCADTTASLIGCAPGVTSCNADGTCATCTPDCTGKQCGSDGCSGLCGVCADATLSTCSQGTCVDPCFPTALKCTVAVCGDNGCGGSCGDCAPGSSCSSGQCKKDVVVPDNGSCTGHCGSSAPAGCYCTATCADDGNCCLDYQQKCGCTPDCAGKECGPNGCGGSCGICSNSSKKFCSAAGQCTAACTPDCSGKTCGDDGCGGTCGACAAGSSCQWTQQCVPDAWKCDPSLYADHIACDCGCGAPDSDCQTAGTSVFNCPLPATKCTSGGLCDTTFCETDATCNTGQWCTGLYFTGGTTFGGACLAPVASASPPGFPCNVGDECASSVCLDGLCRQYCASDAQCPESQLCLGLPVRDSATAALRGVAPVCAQLPGSGAACKAQTDCASNSGACVAVVDAATQGPRYVCSVLKKKGAIGQSCANTACPDGYLCASVGSQRLCTLPCPGGAADCPSGFKCGTVPFTSAASSNPPSVPACVPN